MAEHGGDHRLVAGSLNRLPERWKGLTRLARFKQDLALQLQKIGVVRIGGDQRIHLLHRLVGIGRAVPRIGAGIMGGDAAVKSEEHTSELQSLMRISYAVFCLKKKTIILYIEVYRY